jgi:hypothetical protein
MRWDDGAPEVNVFEEEHDAVFVEMRLGWVSVQRSR